LFELAVDIKRKELHKEIDNVVFGVSKKMPKKSNALIKKKIEKLTVNEKAELKKSIQRLEVATNRSYRSGYRDATEKASIRLHDAKERIHTIKTAAQERWKRVEQARVLVKENVPAKEQGRFLNRVTKARTEGGLSKIADDINVYLDKKRVQLASKDLKKTIKSASKKYSNKSGEFASAPDEIRPLLESIKRFSEGSEVDDLAKLSKDMVDNINKSISGKGEVLGIPESIAKSLTTLDDVSSADNIEAVSKLAKVVIKRAEDAHHIVIGGERRLVLDVVSDSLKKLRPSDAVKDTSKRAGTLSKVADVYGVDSDHPITLIEKMFGQNSKMSTLLDDLYEGEVKAFGVMRNSYQLLRNHMAKNKIDTSIFEKIKNKESVVLGGEKVLMTRDEMLSLAMSMRDPWVYEQLLKTKGYSIGSVSVRAASEKELKDIVSKLTKDEIKLGSMFFELSNKYLSQIGNETSLKLDGIKLFTYSQYYPSHRDYTKLLTGNQWQNISAETKSNFMPRLGGNRPIKIRPFSREMMDYIQNVSMYSGTSSPMRSFKSVLNSEDFSFAVSKAGFKKNLDNLKTILSRSEGMQTDSSVVDVIGSKLLSGYTKSILGGRISTIGTQVGSVPAAKSEIGREYFKTSDTFKSVDELLSSDFFWYRWTGRKVSVELGDSASKSSLSHFLLNKTPVSEKPLSGLIWGDKRAISQIYQAARREASDKLGLVGDDLTRAAIKRAEEVVRKTQPNWSPLTRSKLATDPSLFKRSMTMFRTAQEAQLNILKRGHARYSQTGDTKHLKNAYASVIESQLQVALWKSTWKSARYYGVSKVADWLGVYTPERDESIYEDVIRNYTRTATGIVPMGEAIGKAIETAYDELIKDEYTYNFSSDPFANMAEAASSTAEYFYKYTNKFIDSRSKRKGYTIDFMPTSLDDILDEVRETKKDKELETRKFKQELVRDVADTLRRVSLFTSLPVGPIDEWVFPSLRRSPYTQVNKVTFDNCNNPAELQKYLHKFYTEFNELKDKSDEKGLKKEEARRYIELKSSESIIDAYFSVDDIIDNEEKKTLDPLVDKVKRIVNER